MPGDHPRHPGWLAGADLAYVAGDRSVPLEIAGPQIGVVVVFPGDVGH